MTTGRVGEKALDLALANELATNPVFLHWVLSYTKFAGEEVTFVSCRADHPWGTHPFRTTGSCGEPVVVNRQSETDVLLIVRDRQDRTLGIHIENKRGAGSFTRSQAEMYSQRAEHWIGNQHYGGYEDFDTVLVSPEAFRQRNAEQAALFGCFIPHEAVADYIALFGNASS